jgi:hypothetical protein
MITGRPPATDPMAGRRRVGGFLLGLIPNLPVATLAHQREGPAAMLTRAGEYRRRARECLAAVRTASIESLQGVLIERAQTLLRLAEEQDHEGANVRKCPEHH